MRSVTEYTHVGGLPSTERQSCYYMDIKVKLVFLVEISKKNRFVAVRVLAETVTTTVLGGLTPV